MVAAGVVLAVGLLLADGLPVGSLHHDAMYGRQTVPSSSVTVDDYFHPALVAASEGALRDILGVYRVGAIGMIGADSLLAAARRLAALRPPAVVWRDTFPNGIVFAPAGTSQSLVPSR